MTTADWLRSQIGPAPHPAHPERVSKPGDDVYAFFTRYLRPDMRVLHAYCGDGKLSFWLAGFVPMGEVTGIDPDSSTLRRARARSVVTLAGDVTFERCSLSDLPFGPDEFEAVLLDGPFATEGSPERAVEEVQRVLVPGGVLGARHTVAASRVMTAESNLIEMSLRRQETVTRDLGGEPDAGLRQPGLMRGAGFVNLRVTSSTEQKSGDELLEELSPGGFVPAIDEADTERVEQEARALVSFVTVVETVCWKATK